MHKLSLFAALLTLGVSAQALAQTTTTTSPAADTDSKPLNPAPKGGRGVSPDGSDSPDSAPSGGRGMPGHGSGNPVGGSAGGTGNNAGSTAGENQAPLNPAPKGGRGISPGDSEAPETAPSGGLGKPGHGSGNPAGGSTEGGKGQ